MIQKRFLKEWFLILLELDPVPAVSFLSAFFKISSSLSFFAEDDWWECLLHKSPDKTTMVVLTVNIF